MDTFGAAIARPLRPKMSPVTTLSKVACTLDVVLRDRDVVVSGVTVDAADTRPGDLFVALPGAHVHGSQFCDEARDRGAAAVLTDQVGEVSASRTKLPVLISDRLRESLGNVAAVIYGNDLPFINTVPLLGVTGTNGKTSTVHIVDAILRQLGVPTGISTTVERRTANVSVASRLTSPEAPELHALVRRMLEDGARAIAIEVSAQAMTSHRTDGLTFDVAGFTNLSHDHLDQYGTLETYAAAKAALFTPRASRRGVVSLDSSWGDYIAERAEVPITTISSRPTVVADWQVMVHAQSRTSTALDLRSRNGEVLSTTVSLIGRHMAANTGLALLMLIEAGFNIDAIREAIAPGLTARVPGRSIAIGNERGPQIYVDFAHTPDAFATTLRALRQVTPGRLFMVMGADGDRDATKRAEMGRLSADISDALIITDHHPRFEDPRIIREDLLRGALMSKAGHAVIEVADPATAIRAAIALAHDGDSILWAGPGMTNYRDVEGQHLPYSSFEDARRALTEAGWIHSNLG